MWCWTAPLIGCLLSMVEDPARLGRRSFGISQQLGQWSLAFWNLRVSSTQLSARLLRIAEPDTFAKHYPTCERCNG
jgi:hypothetical protein